MGYIYLITNNINNKKYVGKTVRSIRERWVEHIQNSKNDKYKNRPLYRAMRKYGPDNFSIKELEKCGISILSDREKYWIKYYNSFKRGYNATLGGDGKIYLNYEEVVNLYRETHNIAEVSRKIGCSKDSVSNILKARDIYIVPNGEVTRKKLSKKVVQYDKNGNYIKTFSSYTEAEKAMGNTQRHICDCANGKRKSAYGFIWKWVE